MATKEKIKPTSVVEKLRAVRAEIEDEIQILDFADRQDLRNRTKTSPESINAAISAIGMSEKVSTALGLSAEDARAIQRATSAWSDVEGELRSFLNAVSSANLIRRHQLALITMQTYAITKQLIRVPENAVLLPQFVEMTRLRKLERLKRRAAPPAE